MIKKEPQGDETKVVRQEFDEENILLVMITEGECSNNRLRDNNNNNNNNSFGNATEICYNRLRNSCSWL